MSVLINIEKNKNASLKDKNSSLKKDNNSLRDENDSLKNDNALLGLKYDQLLETVKSEFKGFSVNLYHHGCVCSWERNTKYTFGDESNPCPHCRRFAKVRTCYTPYGNGGYIRYEKEVKHMGKKLGYEYNPMDTASRHLDEEEELEASGMRIGDEEYYPYDHSDPDSDEEVMRQSHHLDNSPEPVDTQADKRYEVTPEGVFREL